LRRKEIGDADRDGEHDLLDPPLRRVNGERQLALCLRW
jgi:hypothetical protein